MGPFFDDRNPDIAVAADIGVEDEPIDMESVLSAGLLDSGEFDEFAAVL